MAAHTVTASKDFGMVGLAGLPIYLDITFDVLQTKFFQCVDKAKGLDLAYG